MIGVFSVCFTMSEHDLKDMRQRSCAFRGVGVLYIGDYSSQGRQVRPLNARSPSTTIVLLTNDNVGSALCARNQMLKVTWVQMSQCVGESLRNKKTCHMVQGISALPLASFHQYQVKINSDEAVFIIKASHYVLILGYM